MPCNSLAFFMSSSSRPARRAPPIERSRTASLGGLETPVPPGRFERSASATRPSPSTRSLSVSSGGSNLNKPLPPSPQFLRRSSSNYDQTQDEIIDSYRSRDDGGTDSLPRPIFANAAATRSLQSLEDSAPQRPPLANARSRSAAPDPITSPKHGLGAPQRSPRAIQYLGSHTNASLYVSPLASPPITASSQAYRTSPVSPPWPDEPRASHWERKPHNRAADLAKEYQEALASPVTSRNIFTMPFQNEVVFAGSEVSSSPQISARIRNPADPSLVPPPMWSGDMSRSPSPLSISRHPQDSVAHQPKPYPSPLSPTRGIPASYTLEDGQYDPGYAPAAADPEESGRRRFRDSWAISPEGSSEASRSEAADPLTSGPTFDNIIAHQDPVSRGVRTAAIPITPYQQMGPKAWEKEKEDLLMEPKRKISGRNLLFGKRNSKEKDKGTKRREELKKTIKVLESSAKSSIGIGAFEREDKGKAHDEEHWI